MNKIQQRRLYSVLIFIAGLALAAFFILYALKQNINVFLTPSQVAATNKNQPYTFRLGGVVKEGSVVRHGLVVDFTVTDFKASVPAQYEGVLPDLFREGKGVIAEGRLNEQGIFIASQVLAKHDENYMPPSMTKKQ